MKYFDTLPKIIHTDNSGNSRVFTNLLARANIIPEVLKNPLVYYSYDIQDGDTPEIIADKYYKDSYRYWIVLFANELLDPQWNWPLSGSLFDDYLKNKYGIGFDLNSVHHYEKVITRFDSETNTTTSDSVQIDVDTYNSLLETTKNYDLPTGRITVQISKNAVSYYTYEYNLNESKRNIRLLNAIYVDQLESEFKKVMA